MRACTFLIALLSCSLLQAKDFVFIGSYNGNTKHRGIYVYSLDTSGELTFVTAVRNVLNPAYLTVSPDGNYLYACTEALIPRGGRICSYSFDAVTGTLKFINDQKSEGENPVYVAVHKSGKWLVCSNYTGGTVSAYPLETNGHVAPASQVIPLSGSSVNAERQTGPHPHAAVFAPNGDYLFVPDLGTDKIRSFTFKPTSAKPLEPMSPPHAATTAGNGPRHLTFHPSKPVCYCIEELSGTVSCYRYENGELNFLQRIAAHDGSNADGYHSADIHVSPDGLFLYASNRGKENNIAICAIDPENGKLKNIGYQSTLGEHPRNFTVDPSGKLLLVSNQFSGNIVVFRRNAKTGLLTYSGHKIKIRGASCIQIKTYTD